LTLPPPFALERTMTNASAIRANWPAAEAATGALWLQVAGADVALRRSGALWLEDEGVLVVADLHLEKGSSYAARGQLLPPYDTAETLTRLEAEVADEVAVGPLTLRHEPLPVPVLGEVSGHLHPCARVVRAGRSVRRRCFLTDGSRLILPAFGAYAGGLNARDVAFADLFARAPLAAVLGDERVHVLPVAALNFD
jgi:metallophosphoesterase superfamily enzyme